MATRDGPEGSGGEPVNKTRLGVWEGVASLFLGVLLSYDGVYNWTLSGRVYAPPLAYLGLP